MLALHLDNPPRADACQSAPVPPVPTIGPVFSSRTMETYADAMSALARADERISLSPHRDILVARLRILENEALECLDPALSPARRQWSADLAQLLTDKLAQAGPSPAEAADPLEDAELMECWHRAGQALPLPTQLAEAKLRRWWQSSLTVRSGPQLLAGADLALEWERLAPLASGNIVTAIMIGDRYVTGNSPLFGGGLTALGMRQLHVAAPRLLKPPRHRLEADEGWADAARLVWLRAITAGANVVIELDCRLRELLTLVEGAHPVGRRPSHLRELVELAIRRPFTTVNLASSRLGIARATAHKLICAALSAQVIREISSERGSRRFVAAL
jgi:hypothetical protein